LAARLRDEDFRPEPRGQRTRAYARSITKKCGATLGRWTNTEDQQQSSSL